MQMTPPLHSARRCAASSPKISLAAAVGLVVVACATPNPRFEPRVAAENADRFAVFEPRPDGRDADVNYDDLDLLLGRVVLRTGPSLRKPVSSPVPPRGSKIVRGHRSAWRLEGNKVLFSAFDRDYVAATVELVESMVKLGNETGVVRLPRGHQLAYWINLHNLLVIAEIAKNYPVRAPGDLELGPEDIPLHRAPLVTINGVPLSLKDIRVGIVYRYWKDPRVMYGFFHGDIGSPSMRAEAYRAEGLTAALTQNTREFVNALRGVRNYEQTMVISPLYREAQSLFPKWPDDFREHLRKYGKDAVRTVVAETYAIRFGRYAERTADLVAGDPFMVASPGLFAMGIGSMQLGQSPSAARMIGELRLKRFQLEQEALRSGTVTIQDEPFPGDDGEIE